MDSTNTRQVGKSHWAVLNAEKTSVIESDKRYFSCPYGRPGDRLWVRETFQGPLVSYDRAQEFYEDRLKFESPEYCEYRADGGPDPVFVDADDEERHGWKPSIHMPRWASRINLEITGVRVERLQDISEQDAKAEGVEPAQCCDAHYHGFSKLWQSINGPDSWDANPWVWVVEFKRVEQEGEVV
nr:hypothetical protein [Marinobacter sp. EN3]